MRVLHHRTGDAMRRIGMMVLGVCTAHVGAVAVVADDVLERAPRPSPARHVDYLRWLNADGTRDDVPNAASQYSAVAAALSPFDDRAALQRAAAGPWDDLPAVASWLDDNRHLLAAFRQAGQAGYCYLGIKPSSDPPGGSDWSGALLYAVVPSLGVFEPATEGLLADGWRAWAAGDRDRLFDHALANLRVAHHLENDWPMVARVTGWRIAERSYVALVGALARCDDPVRLAASLVERLTEADPPLASMSRAYAFQRLTAWDVLQRLYAAADGSTERRVSDSAAASYAYLKTLVSGTAPDWDAVRASVESLGFVSDLAETERYFDRLHAWSELPYHQAPQVRGQIEHAGESLTDLMMGVFVRDLCQPRCHHARVLALQRGVHLLVTLLDFQTQKGRPCESLDELGSGGAQNHRHIDPYSGVSFVYSRTRDGFVLYSVGPDGKDDAARPFLPGTEKGDLVIWPPR